jgi:hypothetical protein
VEVAAINIPKGMRKRFLESVSHNTGIYPLNDEIKVWLMKKLGAYYLYAGNY